MDATKRHSEEEKQKKTYERGRGKKMKSQWHPLRDVYGDKFLLVN